jgi:hypothetical protein
VGLGKQQFPQLLWSTWAGTPLLTVLLNPDGSIVHSELQILTAQQAKAVIRTHAVFFDMNSPALQSVGMEHLWMRTGMALVIFGIRSGSARDRARSLPQAHSGGSSSPWGPNVAPHARLLKSCRSPGDTAGNALPVPAASPRSSKPAKAVLKSRTRRANERLPVDDVKPVITG